MIQTGTVCGKVADRNILDALGLTFAWTTIPLTICSFSSVGLFEKRIICYNGGLDLRVEMFHNENGF